MSQKAGRGVEIAAGERQRPGALRALEPVGAGRLDLRPDRGAQAQEQGQRGETLKRVRRLRRQIGVEQPVRRSAQAAPLEASR